MTSAQVGALQRAIGNQATAQLIGGRPRALRGPAVHRGVGNRAVAAAAAVQRHALPFAEEELVELPVQASRETVVQRVFTAQEEQQVRDNVGNALSAMKAGRNKKRQHPLAFNTSKAFEKGGLRWIPEDIGGGAKASFAKGGTLIKIGRAALTAPLAELQGALVHEVTHALNDQTKVESDVADEYFAYRNEFTMRYGAPITAADVTRHEDSARVRATQSLGALMTDIPGAAQWNAQVAARQQEMAAMSGRAGFNPNNSWKQARLYALMRSNSPAIDVVRHVRTMNDIDKVEARDSKRQNGTHYLPYTNYAQADRVSIWVALGGPAASVP